MSYNITHKLWTLITSVQYYWYCFGTAFDSIVVLCSALQCFASALVWPEHPRTDLSTNLSSFLPQTQTLTRSEIHTPFACFQNRATKWPPVFHSVPISELSTRFKSSKIRALQMEPWLSACTCWSLMMPQYWKRRHFALAFQLCQPWSNPQFITYLQAENVKDFK